MKVTVLDTCSLINLYASQRPQLLIGAVFDGVVVPKQVLSESLFVRRPADDNPSQLVPTAIDIDLLVAKAAVKVTELEEHELELFVRLASILDDGEAACETIAFSRGLGLATDDRKAIAVARDLGLEVVTTPEILMRWIDAASPEREEIREVIKNIERFGRFKPHHASLHAKWWDENGLGGE